MNNNYKLVLANGAFKSGSTWLRDIVKLMRNFSEIPPEYANRRLRHWIRETKIEAFLKDRTVEGVYVSKSHIYLPEIVRKLAQYKNLRVLDIKREIKDVVVSAYYHYKRESEKNISFSEYYWKIGRFKAFEVKQYHASWEGDYPFVLFAEYEKLKEDFEGEVARIANFLGVSLDRSRIAEIKEQTSLENLRKQRGEEDAPEEARFFRKGVTGDWMNHFEKKEFADIEKIDSSGLWGLDYAYYYLAFPTRRRIDRLRKRCCDLISPERE